VKKSPSLGFRWARPTETRSARGPYGPALRGREGIFDSFTASQPTSVAEIRTKFEESLAGAKAVMSRWGERDLATVWRFQKGGKDLMALPKAAMLRALVLNHHVHHRGQLTVYLRLLDVPLPSVYGPSADENPFMPKG